MQNFFYDNLGLCVTRQLSTLKFYHAFISRNASDMCFISIKTKEAGYAFPLYIYHSKEAKGLFHAEGEPRAPNIKPDIFKSLSKTYRKEISPEGVFYYIYAILYSPTYRKRYEEFLKIDFPRVPFTKDYALFKRMAEYGNRLIDLHLLKSSDLDLPIAKFQGKGNDRVEKVRYDNKAGLLYINEAQYFEGISNDVWGYQIGGYQVCDKWLKDRKGRVLSLDEIQTYCRIVTAIQKTIEMQKAIDEVYEKAERELC